MGLRGPAPKPTALRILDGEKRYRINLAEPRPTNRPPEMPQWLTGKAADEWNRVLPELIHMGTAKAVDMAGLAAYCECVALFERLTVLVEATGPLIVGRDGLAHKNPAVAMLRGASAEVRVWAREFGLTPAARQPLRIEHSVGAGLPAERLLS
jgi:P27 family predicted phage terminase small subunit